MKKWSYIGLVATVSLCVWQGSGMSNLNQAQAAAPNQANPSIGMSRTAPSVQAGTMRLQTTSKRPQQTGQEATSVQTSQPKLLRAGTSLQTSSVKASTSTYDQSKINHRQMIVSLKKGITEPLIIQGTQLIRQNGQTVLRGIEILQVEPNQNYAEVLNAVQQSSRVETASPNYIQHVSYTPTNSLIKEQWYLKSINLFKGWDITTGAKNPVTVAVLDTGVNANQPELSGHVLPGYNFVDNNTDTSDNNGHGTAVAGLIAANANSGGVVGVDFNAKILPIKVADQKGDLQDALIIQGILYAIKNGAQVINMSFGGTAYDQALNDAIQKAHDAGIVVVAAAGNDNAPTWEFPASDDNVISVAATDESNYPAYFSDWGNFVDMAAPGLNMLILQNPTGYTNETGTSFSTPLVSGTAALLKSLHPDWSPDLIEWALENSANGTTNHAWDSSLGYGVLNVDGALSQTPPAGYQTIPSSAAKAVSLNNGQAVKRSFILPNEKDWYSFTVGQQEKITLHVSGGSPTYDFVGDLYKKTNSSLTKLTSIDNAPVGEPETYTFVAQPGTYDLSVFDYFGHWSKIPYSVEMTAQMIPAPAPSVKAGTYANPLSVTLTAPKGDSIKYTLDGSNPSNTNGFTYSAPISIKKTTTLKAVTLTSTGSSNIATYTYTIQPPLFPDIAGNWAQSEITYLAKNGWIHGYANGHFGPNDVISRAEAAKIIAAQLKLSNAIPDFKDVGANNFAYGAIGAVEKAGIIHGHQDGTFDPNGSITRGQVAAILVNAYHLTGSTATQFKDVQSKDWDAAFIQTLVANHIVSGYADQTFMPNKAITRGEFSVMLTKVLDPTFRG